MYVILTQLVYQKSKPLKAVVDLFHECLGERPVVLHDDDFDWSAPKAVVSFLWNKIIRPEQFNLPEHGTFNIHPSFLPENRGAAPNFWAIRRFRGAGWTLHRIDEKIDTGPILSRYRTRLKENETGEELHYRLLTTELDTFLSQLRYQFHVFKNLKEWPTIEQEPHWPTYKMDDLHRARNLLPTALTLPERLLVLDTLRTILAATYTGHDGAYIDTDDGRVYFKAYKKDSDES